MIEKTLSSLVKDFSSLLDSNLIKGEEMIRGILELATEDAQEEIIIALEEERPVLTDAIKQYTRVGVSASSIQIAVKYMSRSTDQDPLKHDFNFSYFQFLETLGAALYANYRPDEREQFLQVLFGLCNGSSKQAALIFACDRFNNDALRSAVQYYMKLGAKARPLEYASLQLSQEGDI